MLDFSAKVEERNNDLIPTKTVLWAIMNIRGLKASHSGGQYLDVELTIDDGQPFARRKIWDMIGDPMHSGNSEAYRQMGYATIRRILEASFGANPANPESYKVLNDPSYRQLQGARVPVQIKVEKGKDGYEDKNKVEFLSPHSSVKSIVAAYENLKAGNHSPAPAANAPAAQTPVFGGAPTPAAASPAAQPTWLGMPATGGNVQDEEIPF